MIWRWIHAALRRTLLRGHPTPAPRPNSQSCKLTVEVLEDRWVFSHSPLGASFSNVAPLHLGGAAHVVQAAAASPSGRSSRDSGPTAATDDSYQVQQGHTLTIGGHGVLTNDRSHDGALTATVVTGPTHGMLVLHTDGSFVYTPTSNFHGQDSFTYQAKDQSGGTSIGTVRIAVKPAQTPVPVANPDSASTNENTSTTISVLSNDTGLTSSVSVSAGSAANGTTMVNSDHTVTYTPNSGFNSTDTFTYTVTDSGGHSSSATVTVHVFDNDPPVANSDSATTNENTSTTIDVLSNDSGLNDMPVSVIAGSAVNGSTMVNSDHSVTYTPNNSTFNGSDSFTYTVTDSEGASSMATVSVSVMSNVSG